MPESMSSLSGILLKRKQIRFSNLIFRFSLNLRNTLGATKNGNTLVICLVPQSSDSFRRFLSITSTRYPFQTSHAYPVQKWPPQHKLQNTRTVSLYHFFCVKKKKTSYQRHEFTEYSAYFCQLRKSLIANRFCVVLTSLEPYGIFVAPLNEVQLL